VLLASRQGDDKVTLVAGISKELQSRKLSAGEWIRPVAAEVGGGGGGRPDMAQAGGKNPAKLPQALQIAKETIRSMLAP
jgi:alanyl-tRNA synthetase